MYNFIYSIRFSNNKKLLEYNEELAFQIMCSEITSGEIKILNRMEYEQFLKSSYWMILKRYLIHKYDCRCGNTEGLVIHHKNYEHRGYEYKHLNDLVVLCPDCHTREHMNDLSFTEILKAALKNKRVKQKKPVESPNYYDSKYIHSSHK